MEIYMPIAPQIEQGTITVKIRTLSQIHKQTFDIDLEILVRSLSFSNYRVVIRNRLLIID